MTHRTPRPGPSSSRAPSTTPTRTPASSRSRSQRTNTNGPEVVYYGVTNKSSGAGNNFDKVANSELDFAPGQSTATFNVTIHDQGINGPLRTARAYLYGAHPQALGSPARRSSTCCRTTRWRPRTRRTRSATRRCRPTVIRSSTSTGTSTGRSRRPAPQIAQVAHANPGWAQALHTIAYSPGSGTYRFWMWNQPASSLASTVEKYLADAEVAQPNTTVALSSYSLVHGACERPEGDQEPLRELDHAAGARDRQLPRRAVPRGGLADRDPLPQPRRDA